MAEALPTSEHVRPVALDFDQIYEAWFHEVSRWVRAFGGLHDRG